MEDQFDPLAEDDKLGEKNDKVNNDNVELPSQDEKVVENTNNQVEVNPVEVDQVETDPTILIEKLINHNVFDRNVNSRAKVVNSPEFMVLSRIFNETRIDLDTLINSFDTRGFLINLTSSLLDQNIINHQDGVMTFTSSFIDYLKSDELVQGQEISTNEVVESQTSTSFEGDEDTPIQVAPPREKKPITDEQLSELDEKLSGSRTRREKLLSQLANQTPFTEKETTKQVSDDGLDDLFDDVLGESLEDVMGEFEELQISESSQSGELGIIGPLVELLMESGYIDDDMPEAAYTNVPGYQVLTAILWENPIDTEKIEEKITTDLPTSMLLSNLKADDLITQTNDYRWTLSKKTLRSLRKFIEDRKLELGTKKIDEDEKLFDQLIDNEVVLFKKALVKLGYIYEDDEPLSEYLNKPEVEVLNIFRQYGAMDSEGVKSYAQNVMPVVISRMISKLKADGVIDQDNEGNWKWSSKLKFLMVQEKLKAQLDEEVYEHLLDKYQ